MATIHDVARRAGVGVGTVSRVINDSPLVSDATRAKVEAVIEELNFRPSTLGRALSLGKATTLGIVAPFLTHPSVVERLRGISSVIQGSDLDMVLYDIETVAQRDEVMGTLARRGHTAGMLLVSLPPTDADLALLQRGGIPAVVIDGRSDDVPHLYIDNVTGGRIATQHLLDLGHRRIGFVGDLYASDFGFTSSVDRSAGYRKALSDAGIDPDPDLIRLGPHGKESAAQLARELLEVDDRPTAVVAASDLQALGVIEELRSHGLSVPEDMSVVGFDDIEVANYLNLTTVHQPLYESGQLGAQRLMSLIAGEEIPKSEELELTVVVRSSTAPPA